MNIFNRNPGIKKQIEEVRPRLYKVAFSWCHDHDITDDLVQETMIKAFNHVSKLRDKSLINSWCFKILTNCWRDHLRRLKPTEDIEHCIFTNDETPELTQERQDITDIVQYAISCLPQGQRQVVTLVDLEGFSYTEVSDILTIPSGTVMSRLNRARKALSELLLELKDNHSVQHGKHIRVVK